jgi:hypothetical protein
MLKVIEKHEGREAGEELLLLDEIARAGPPRRIHMPLPEFCVTITTLLQSSIFVA